MVDRPKSCEVRRQQRGIFDRASIIF